ncbi:MAG: hybrid sensor histidine kinase/response regulator [Noviherbaspirillum sp.]
MQQLALLRAAATLAATGLQTARITFEREASSRAKDEFLAMLGHELRNPLASISAAADLLQLASLSPVQLKRTSDIIARQVVHMTSLVNELLDVSRVTSGLVSIEKTPLDLRAVVMDAIEQARSLIDARGHRFNTRFQLESVAVAGEHKRLVQVLTNLLSNAAKYTPEGGNILLEVTSGSAEVSIVVSDDGIGIDPVLLPTVFDLFTQAKRSSDRSQGGLGLGLVLVKSLIELHGGTVAASSAGEGAGSRFAVCLKRLPSAAPAALPGAALRVGSGEHPLRIMVVDDNVDAAFMVAMLLETLGHEVQVENDAYKALALAGSAKPDVWLLDIGLPGMAAMNWPAACAPRQRPPAQRWSRSPATARKATASDPCRPVSTIISSSPSMSPGSRRSWPTSQPGAGLKSSAAAGQ